MHEVCSLAQCRESSKKKEGFSTPPVACTIATERRAVGLCAVQHRAEIQFATSTGRRDPSQATSPSGMFEHCKPTNSVGNEHGGMTPSRPETWRCKSFQHDFPQRQ